MRIGELAEAAGVTPKTVRYYESIGLMPSPGRTASGYRHYDPALLDRLRFIRDAQATGLSLTEIASILELKDAGQGACDHTRALLAGHVAEIDRQLERLAATRAALAALSDRVADLDPAHCTDPTRCQVISTAHGGHVGRR